MGYGHPCRRERIKDGVPTVVELAKKHGCATRLSSHISSRCGAHKLLEKG